MEVFNALVGQPSRVECTSGGIIDMYLPNDIKHLHFDVYIRRSSDDDDHQTASLERQRNEINPLIKQETLTIGKRFEESRSAKIPDNRPLFDELIERIES